jgi:DNA-binding beta-propeller fold protein YncE
MIRCLHNSDTRAALSGAAALWLAMAPVDALSQITVTNLQSPYSFVSSTSGTEYFISSVNGDPESADNNGFITKLDASGKILNLKFIQGGMDGVTLNAPKGMASVEQTLYVADLSQLRMFDAGTGKPIGSLTIPTAPGQAPPSLTDVAYDGAGLLYCSDQHANRIYRVQIAQRKVALLVADPSLAGPAGLAVHPKSGQLIAVSWEKGKIFAITPEGAVSEIFSNGFFSSRFSNLRGVDFDRWGNMYVSDFTTGKVWRMTWDKRFQVIAEYLPSPGDLGIDRTNNLILVPYEFAHAAEMNGLEAPRDGKSKQEKRTLADYGFVPPPPKPAEGGEKK